MTRVLILAGGPNLGWDGPVRRHMVMVPSDWAHGTEPLIQRTQRQVLEFSDFEVAVITQPENIDYVLNAYPKVAFQVPDKPTRGWEQEWDGSRSLWHPTEQTILLLGDTYYSDGTIQTVLADDTDHWHFFARFQPNERKPYGEGLAWSIHPSAHEHLDVARMLVKQHVETGAHHRASGWEVYRQACGLPVWLHAREYVHGIEIAMWDSRLTEDFDNWDDYLTWMGRYE